MTARHVGKNIQKVDTNVKKLFSKLFSVFLLVIIFFFLVFSIIFTYKIIVLNENNNTIAGFKILTIGPGNTTQYNEGDLIIVRKVPINMINKGDAITCYKDSIIETYKISEVKDNELIALNNDNNSFFIDYRNILGKYVFSIPKGKYLLETLGNPFIIFIIFILVLVNISLLIKTFSK